MRGSGELEREIMSAIWQTGTPLTGHDVLAALDATHNTAYTTVVTVLERLRDKGMLTRFRDGRSYRYQAAVTDEEYAASLMSQVLDGSSNRSAALLRFAGTLDDAEVTALRAALEASRSAGDAP